MKFYEITGDRVCGEQSAKDICTGKAVTLCDRCAIVHDGDYLTAYRCEAVDEDDYGETVIQFNIMTGGDRGTVLNVIVCDFETGAQIIARNLKAIICGTVDGDAIVAVLEKMREDARE